MQSSFRYYLLGIIFCAGYSINGWSSVSESSSISESSSQIANAQHTSDNPAQWQLASETKNVAIYKRITTTGYIEVRGVTQVRNTPEAFTALLAQTALAPKWIANNQEVTVLSSQQNTRVVHSKFNAPWPLKNRDMVTKSTTYYKDNTLYIDIIDASTHYAESAGFVRIRDVSGQWVLSSAGNGVTIIEYRGQANPGGNIPIWLANRTLISSMSETFENIVYQLDNPPQTTQD
ncbi:hypothetical protein JEU11_07410 [Paraglaciecola chathamensis]|uniref:START domain-containing protein n=1 Tax=Paraglaciecola chathamensis TaxID=368405 RepID=A0ABS0WCS1_9ALTE|nr:START domain-containing protein [Paraglaciecola chathamensis]MBJ2136275.1 hypothetical protein [Paraglaciecola chathamensis]